MAFAEVRRLRFNRQARAELDAAIEWYELQRPGLGEEFFAAVDRLVKRLREMPGLGSAVAAMPTEKDIRKLSMRRFPYTIAYAATETELLVLAVAHQRRRPNYWRSRLK